MPDPVKPEERAPAPKAAPGHVFARVLKKGDGKIFTGETPTTRQSVSDQFRGEHFFPTHKFGDIVELPLRIAQAQEDNGYVEIQE